MGSSVGVPLDQKIASVIREQPGITAREIANRLAVERNKVNGLLYGALGAHFVQDEKYRWYPAELKKQAPRPREGVVDTTLSRLCRYYLACIGHDDSAGVSVFARNQYGDPDYEQMVALPTDDGTGLFESQGAQRLLGKLRRDKGRLAMYFGYPVLLRKHQAKNGWQGFFVEPLILLPIDVDDTAPTRGRRMRGSKKNQIGRA